MQKCILFLVLLSLNIGCLISQPVNWSLNFDSGSLPTNVIASSGISFNNNLFVSSTHSLNLNFVATTGGNSSLETLTLPSLSISGYNYLEVKFVHICKIEAADRASIEYSIDAGQTWIQLNADLTKVPNAGSGNCFYFGNENYFNNNNAFSSGSNPIKWFAGQPLAIPDNNWWVSEYFLIPLDWVTGQSTSQIQIRFKLEDTNLNGTQGAFGWLLDDVELILHTCNPKSSTVNVPFETDPFYSGTVYGPNVAFEQTFTAANLMGVQAAQIVYSVNGGNFINIPATLLANPERWVATFPNFNHGDEVDWRIEVMDSTSCHVVTKYPINSYFKLKYVEDITFPLCDEFNVNSIFFNPISQQGSLNWRIGNNSYDSINFHSIPKAWVIGESGNVASYKNGYECYLSSVDFNIEGGNFSDLSFWYYTNLEPEWDGFRVDYSIDLGQTWVVLGSGVSDPLGINWFNSDNLISSGYPGWTGNSQTMKQATYRLSSVSEIATALKIRFRFVFTADHCISKGGVIIDDFCLNP